MNGNLKVLDDLTNRVNESAQRLRVAGHINEITDREAMGLNDALVDFYSDVMTQLNSRMWGKSTAELRDIAQSQRSHVLERLCAANALNFSDARRADELPEFLDIPAGSFWQGTDETAVTAIWKKYSHLGVERNWIEKETPKHEVKISRFTLSKYPITNRQYKLFLTETGSPSLPSSWHFGGYPTHLANHPVYTLKLTDIDLYCEWLSRKIGLVVRLPTESEWEYAGGNGFGWQYTWGNDFAPFHCNTNEALLQSTTPVGIFLESTNRWGIADLIGNVEEFVSDDYMPYPGARIVEDDLYKKLGRYRIAKGGAFNRFSDLARVQRRHGAYPSSLYAIGFRVACS